MGPAQTFSTPATHLAPDRLGSLLYTGASSFLQANPWFAQSLVAASEHCAIHASEDIFDVHGVKLWARGREIDGRLLERLADRKLRKPIELCVYAADPVATAAIPELIEQSMASDPDLHALLEAQWHAVHSTLRTIVPSPTELLLLSVLHHGPREMLAHAALVAGIAITACSRAMGHADILRTIGRAALFHDVGLLYLAPEGTPDADDPAQRVENARVLRSHPLLSAQVTVELARSGAVVGTLIAMSHERLDGSGYPRGLVGANLPAPAQALLFAEECARFLGQRSDALRRSSVALRLVPHEFPGDLVNWISALAQTRPVATDPQQFVADLEERLRDDHERIGQLFAQMAIPVGETDLVRRESAKWMSHVMAMVISLRRTGAEEMFSQGMRFAPATDLEALELSALDEELVQRLEALRLNVLIARAAVPEFGASSLIAGVLELLQQLPKRPPGAPVCAPASSAAAD